MNRKCFEQMTNLKVGELTWRPGYTISVLTATLGYYQIHWHHEEDTFEVIRNNSVVHWFNEDFRRFL